MSRKNKNPTVSVHTTTRAFREFILESTEDELDEAIQCKGEDLSELAAKGRAAAEAAIASYLDASGTR